MKNKKLLLIIVAAVMLMAAGITAFATGSFKMTYNPGTEDTVTNMPAEADWAAGANTVASNVPEREGYEFAGWKLDYEETHPYYTVRYVLNGTDTDLADRRTVSVYDDKVYGVTRDEIKITPQGEPVKIGDRVTEKRIDIAGYNLCGKTILKMTIDADNSKNVIIFYYDMEL